ncbi:hypothetical protein [Nocardia sp. NPDC020380]
MAQTTSSPGDEDVAPEPLIDDEDTFDMGGPISRGDIRAAMSRRACER